MLFRFSVKGQLLLLSLILCYVNLLFTLVIAFLKLLSGSSESLANAPDKNYSHMLKYAFNLSSLLARATAPIPFLKQKISDYKIFTFLSKKYKMNSLKMVLLKCFKYLNKF